MDVKVLGGLAAYLLLLLIFSIVHYVLNDAGITTEEVAFDVDDHVVTGIYALPSPYVEGTALPGVLVLHGFIASKEWMAQLTGHLARSGFAVLSIDQFGHGGNTGSGIRVRDETNETITNNGIDAVGALEYLAAKPEVNASLLGAAGWSMGASTVLSLNKAFRLGLTSLRLESSVLIGNLLRCENNPFDLNFPLNLLNLVGINDELFDPTEALTVMSECVVNGTVTEGTFYGSFADANARQVVFTESDHIFEAVEPEIIARTESWMKASFARVDAPLPPLAAVESLNYEFFGAIIGTMWLFLFGFVFELLAPESPSTALVIPEKEKVDTAVREAESGTEKAELYKWWWWITHNLLVVLALAIGYAAELIIGLPLCVSFGITMTGWAIVLPLVFSVSIYTKKGLDFYNACRKAPLNLQSEALKCDSDARVKVFLASPLGMLLIFVAWFIIIVAVMAAVPFTYGFAVPMFRGIDFSSGRRIVVFMFAWVLYVPGYYFELVLVSLRITREFTLKNVGQLILARTWLFFLILLFILITVFGAQARVLGQFSFFTLIIYPTAFIFSLGTILIQFGRSRSIPDMSLAVFTAGLTALILAQILPFEGC